MKEFKNKIVRAYKWTNSKENDPQRVLTINLNELDTAVQRIAFYQIRDFLMNRYGIVYKPDAIIIKIASQTSNIKFTEQTVEQTETIPNLYRWSNFIKQMVYFATEYCNTALILGPENNTYFCKTGKNRDYIFYKTEPCYGVNKERLDRHNAVEYSKVSFVDYEAYNKIVYELSRVFKDLYVEPEIYLNREYFENNYMLEDYNKHYVLHENIKQELFSAYSVEVPQIYFKAYYNEFNGHHCFGQELSVIGEAPTRQILRSKEDNASPQYRAYTSQRALNEAQECLEFFQKHGHLFLDYNYKLDPETGEPYNIYEGVLKDEYKYAGLDVIEELIAKQGYGSVYRIIPEQVVEYMEPNFIDYYGSETDKDEVE
jgi:hypothetical protein